MILIIFVLAFGFGFGKRCNEIYKYNEIERNTLRAEAEARQRKIDLLQDELNNIEFQIEMLCRLEDVQRIDTTKTRNEHDIKKALATQTKIHALVKRKNKIEYELNQLIY